MHSLLLPRLQRWQVRYALSIWLLLCIISCASANGDDIDASTSQRHLRQPPIKRIDQPSPSISVLQEERELSIFGKDGRQQVSNPTVYPYTTVGLLRWNAEIVCTGTLVASNMVLTAAECVLDSNGDLRDNSQGPATFTLPQTTEVQTASITRAHKQSDFWTQWTQNTYVLIELEEELGTTNGALHLPTANSFEQDKPMNVQLVSFGSNVDAGECFQLCKIHFPSEFNGPEYMIHHECDVSAKRSPGSPMLIRSTDLVTYIIGIHTNAIGDDQIEENATKTYPSYNDTVANRGVLGSFVQPHLSFLLQQSESMSSSNESPSTLQVTQAPVSDTSSSSTSFSGDSAPNSRSNSQGQDDQHDAGSAALAPASASSSSAEASVASPQLGIAATAAYSCIGLVCASWLAIIFVAARRIRSNR